MERAVAEGQRECNGTDRQTERKRERERERYRQTESAVEAGEDRGKTRWRRYRKQRHVEGDGGGKKGSK